jgi:hypothetical protein
MIVRWGLNRFHPGWYTCRFYGEMICYLCEIQLSLLADSHFRIRNYLHIGGGGVGREHQGLKSLLEAAGWSTRVTCQN